MEPKRAMRFLLHRLVELGIEESLLSVKTEVVVPSRKAKVRYPDLVVLTEALEAQMDDGYRCIIQAHMPPPCMVAEALVNGHMSRSRFERTRRVNLLPFKPFVGTQNRF